jgi:hypothetical protein
VSAFDPDEANDRPGGQCCGWCEDDGADATISLGHAFMFQTGALLR